MKGIRRKVSGALKKVTGGSSSYSRGGSSSHHTPEPTPSPRVMDYTEEHEAQDEPQAEDMEMDDDDAPYLDLRDDRERQDYAILKKQSFGHTKAFDSDLLAKTAQRKHRRAGRQAPSRRSTSSSSSGVPNLARRTASSRDFGSITQQLGELRVQANNIEDTLHKHIETNQAWQQYTGDRIHAMEQRQLQQQEEWRAYYRWRGFNPDQ
ncbi:hypothetical protein C2845_PMPSC029380 [Panicum miliaceum]|uniref:Uncharacterized protein n=1 Tax=Panicum miliaceum TaxID=4540 RepID=A0A3L6PB79_PANMI|nr:hypothetical protein C2845_PMPSC029380 [Panicum miliaceum]